MKSFLLILLAILSIATIDAQVKTTIITSPELSIGLGAKAGAEVSVRLSNRACIVPGIYWELRNRVDDENSSRGYELHARDIMHYISVPVRLGISLAGSENCKISGTLLFGPYAAYGISGTSRLRITENGITTHSSCDAFSEGSQCHDRFDYGLNFGANIVLQKHYVVGFYGECGFKHIYEFQSILSNLFGSFLPGMSNHIAFGLNLGYQF